jgi:hypothetical protein
MITVILTRNQEAKIKCEILWVCGNGGALAEIEPTAFLLCSSPGPASNF